LALPKIELKPGLWTVSAWNNKDATLLHEDGTFETLTKNEFPSSFGGRVFVGEVIVVEYIIDIHPQSPNSDERERLGHSASLALSQRMKDLATKEFERRARYGGVASIPEDK
jgi:hypothetical protein